jgi:hypothetical protein
MAELVLEAWNMALWQRRPTSVVHHSVQGSQYTSVPFGKRGRELGGRPSTNSLGGSPLAFERAAAEAEKPDLGVPQVKGRGKIAAPGRSYEVDLGAERLLLVRDALGD